MQVSKVWITKVDFGKMKAFADVEFSLIDGGESAMTWKGFRLFDGDNGQWLGMPSQKVEKDGETNYFDIIKFTKDNEEATAFMTHILEEVQKAYVGTNAGGKNKKAKPEPDGSGIDDDDDFGW